MEEGSLPLYYVALNGVLNFSDFLILIFILLVLLLILFSIVCESFRKVSKYQLLKEINEKDIPKFNGILDRSDRIYNSTLVGRYFVLSILLIIVFFWLSDSFTQLDMTSLICGTLIIFGLNIFCTNFLAIFYANRRPNSILKLFLPLQAKIAYFFYPIIILIEVLNKVFTRISGIKDVTDDESIAEQTLFDAIYSCKDAELLSTESAKMMKQVLDLKDTTVSEIMTPRTDMISISQEDRITEALKLAHENGHSRIPVYIETRDNIQGIFYTRDLIPLLSEGKSLTEITLESIIRKPPTIIPETKNVIQLLNEMRSSKISMAVVVDEYGGTAGIITLEDVIEEIVGEIRDEYDESEEVFDIVAIDIEKGIFEADGRCRIVDINEELNAKIDEEEDYDTLGGYLSFKSGQVPTQGEKIEDPDYDYFVLKADDRKILKVKIVRKETPPISAD